MSSPITRALRTGAGTHRSAGRTGAPRPTPRPGRTASGWAGTGAAHNGRTDAPARALTDPTFADPRLADAALNEPARPAIDAPAEPNRGRPTAPTGVQPADRPSGTEPADRPSGTEPSGTEPSGTEPSGTGHSGSRRNRTAESSTEESGNAQPGTKGSGTEEPPTTESGTAASGIQPVARPGTFAALRVRNYRLFFSGQIVSNTGTWMQRIAQDWLVLQLTNSPLAVGITTALQFLPMLLFGLWGGLIADRYPKRRLLLITQTVMGVLAVLLAGLTLGGVVQVWQVYLIAFGLGLATVVDNPTRQTFVNEMVPTELVRNAVGLNSGNFQLARMLGPAVAGVLIAAVGIGWAFAFNALSFAAVLAALLMMRPAELQRLPHAARARGQLREGLRYVRQNPILLWPIVLVFFIGTFGYNFAIILSAYTQNVFQSGADLYGLLNTAMAAGSVTGALFAARRTSARLPVLFLAAAGFGFGLIVLGLTPWFWPFLVLLVVVGFVSVTFNTLGNATVQLSSSPELRGRVMSLYMLVFMGGTPIGSPIVGAITQHWGAPAALVVSGVICLLAAAGSAALAARSAGSSLRVGVPAAGRRLAGRVRIAH